MRIPIHKEGIMVKRASLFSILLCSILFITGCALAPLSSSFEGRSMGKGKVGVDIGASPIGNGYPTFKFTYGLASKLDIGLQYEAFSMGLFGKYSFINHPTQGFSLAGLFSAGKTTNGSYSYIGPVLSYKSKTFEPYFVARLNVVQYDEDDIGSGITISSGKYTYLQMTGGSVIWLSRKIGFNFEISTFGGPTGSAEIEGALFLGGLKIRF